VATLFGLGPQKEAAHGFGLEHVPAGFIETVEERLQRRVRLSGPARVSKSNRHLASASVRLPWLPARPFGPKWYPFRMFASRTNSPVFAEIQSLTRCMGLA
jgi:hypothetical protein